MVNGYFNLLLVSPTTKGEYQMLISALKRFYFLLIPALMLTNAYGQMKSNESPAPPFKSTLLKPNTWLIQGSGASSYLVVGTKAAIMIDTGMSYENIQKFAQTLTKIPVTMTVNTHGHFDHTGGNMYFEKVYMHARAIESAKTPFANLDATKFNADYPVYTVKQGYKFELGDRNLEVIEIPAHSLGSIALLDKKERILFTGDEIAKQAGLWWRDTVEQPPVEQSFLNVMKLKKRLSEYDYIAAGHASELANAADMINGILEIELQIMQGVEGTRPEPGAPQGLSEYMRNLKINGYGVLYDIRYIHLPNIK
jgi:glyoxylase-like metal-dependent hydrolase (beta-lactamase superfamily II)